MEERVLLLMPESDVGHSCAERLERYQVDSIRWARTPNKLSFGVGWFKQFNMIVISDVFCDNGRDTAILVRKIRTEFTDPMIVFSECPTNEGPFACRVAGCNFRIKSHWSKDLLISAICELVNKISAELARAHQKETV